MTYGYGIKYNLGRGQFGISPIIEPCLTNISQWFGETYEDSGLYYQTDKADTVVPIGLKSGIVSFNGVDNAIKLANLEQNKPQNISRYCFGFTRNGKASGAYHAIFTSLNVGFLGLQIYIPNTGNNLSFYIGTAKMSSYIVDLAYHEYDIQINHTTGITSVIVDNVLEDTVLVNVPTVLTLHVVTLGNLSPNFMNGEMTYFKTYDISGDLSGDCFFGSKTGTTVYDISGNSNNGLVLGTIANFWTVSENGMPHNLIYGYNIGVSDEFIPADPNNLSFDVLGDPIVYAGIGETGTGHNMCETSYVLEHYGELTITELINHVEVGVRIFFELTKVGETIIKVDKIVTYDPNEPAPSNECLADTLKYVSMYFFMFNLMITENTINYLTLI